MTQTTLTTNCAVHNTDSAKREISRLSKLDPVDYQLERKQSAKSLGFQISALDELVDNERPKLQVVESPNDGCDALALEPSTEKATGIDIHSQMVELIRRYVHIPNDHMAKVVALWCLFTHAIESFRIAPKLLITAPDRACGKTTFLEVVASLACRCESLIGVSPAVIYRIIEAHRPTLAFDEVDNMRNSPGYDEVSAIMNAGHKRGSYVWRCDGEDHEPKKFFVFGAQLIAMIGRPKDTTASRSIVVELERANASESKKLSDISDIDPLSEWEPLRAKALRWAIDNADLLKQPALIPDGVHGRHRDNWRPLLRVAEVIGDEKLLETARTICTQTSGGAISAHGFTDRMMMAINLELSAYVENHPTEENIHSSELYRRLTDNHEELIPDDWTAKRLTRFIGKYNCSSTQCRALGKSLKGYAVKGLLNVVTRYTGSETETTKQTATELASSVSIIETGVIL